MTQEIVIQLRITVPDGASYRVISAPEPDSVLSEPIPPAPDHVVGPMEGDDYRTARRGIAVQQPTSQQWVPGLVHATGHKPLKPGKNGGVYCSTLLSTNPDGTKVWCSFRA